MSDSDDTVSIENVRVLRGTIAALCFTIGRESKERWVPRSVVHDDSFVYEPGHTGTMVVAEWWATKNGFE